MVVEQQVRTPFRPACPQHPSSRVRLDGYRRVTPAPGRYQFGVEVRRLGQRLELRFLCFYCMMVACMTMI